MLKIALTGAHGTGKTTLLNFMSENLMSAGKIHTCREAPRLITEYLGEPHFFRRDNNTPSRQALIFFEHLAEERRQGKDCDLLLTDRTLIDHLAYSLVLFPSWKNSLEYRITKRTAIDTLEDYDLIFRLPIEFPVIDDGVRESSKDFQLEIDVMIDQLYRDANKQTTNLTGSVDQRFATASQAIQTLSDTQGQQENE